MTMLAATEFLEKRGENYFCKYHNRFVKPMLFATPPDEPKNACPECLEEEFGQVLSVIPANDNVVEIIPANSMCHVGTCYRRKHRSCDSCGEDFCEQHITTYSGCHFCDECDPVKGGTTCIGSLLDEDADPDSDEDIMAS